MAPENNDSIYQDVLISNAERKIAANTFTTEKKIEFLKRTTALMDKVSTGKVDESTLTKLNEIVEQPILDTLEQERIIPIRYQLHKNICISASQLMEHCPAWPDESIKKLQLSTYLANEKHCDIDHNEAIAQLAEKIVEKSKDTKLQKILIDASH